MERIYSEVIISEKAEASVRGGHPWIFDGEVKSIFGAYENGDIVDVYSKKHRWLCSGFINDNSKIRIRTISRNTNDRFDEAFWERRIKYAVGYRAQVMGDDFDCCRLIFGEADQMPGLTVDKYGDVLVTEVLCLGISRIKNLIYSLLCRELALYGVNVKTVYEKSDSPICAKEGITPFCGFADGFTPTDGRTVICENGIKYNVDYASGQKTGFFLDQKYNRRASAAIAKSLRVLDCCTHTGAFALNAAKGGAAHVTAVDISSSALDCARANAALNGLEDVISFVQADVFELLTRLNEEKCRDYDYIILDPPAFTKSSRTVHSAYTGYKEINKLAMKLLPRGGYLATCSCSHFMTSALFERMLAEAASEAGVSLRQIEIRRQAPDHPILWGVPETEYLKFYIFQVV